MQTSKSAEIFLPAILRITSGFPFSFSELELPLDNRFSLGSRKAIDSPNLPIEF